MNAPDTAASEAMPARSSGSEGFSFSTYLLSFAIAVLIYALSPGPVAKYICRGKRPVPPAYTAIYAPIGYCCQRFDSVGRFYWWYINDVCQVP